MKSPFLRFGISCLGASLATVLWMSGTSGPALAQTTEKPNNCTINSVECYSDIECLGTGTLGPSKEPLNICVATDPEKRSTCQYNCTGPDRLAAHDRCSKGETCVPVVEGGEGRPGNYWCKPGAFTMDANLVDMCVAYYLEGRVLSAEQNSTCSLGQNLTRMLNQNTDGKFDVLDVDLCLKSFLEPTRCDPSTKTCPEAHSLYCDADATCGHGLFCNTEVHRCERECGEIVDRASGGTDTLQLQCFGKLTWCDESRGRCVPVPEESLEKLTCQVDRGCPAGAFCLIGKCAPQCDRSVDCPDANWYCNKLNQCAPIPQATSGPGERAFNPTEYAVHLATKNVVLDPVNYDSQIPLVIMDTLTKKQVFDRPQVVFGYRLELEYLKKLAPDCLKTGNAYTNLPVATKEDCEIDKSEYFVIPEAPFGTIYGDGTPTIPVRLNQVATSRLSPGRYQAILRIKFNNGSSDSAVITFQKTQLGGNYTGRLITYFGNPDQPVASSGLSLQMGMDLSARTNWHELLSGNFLVDTDKPEEIVDFTEGHPIVGRIHGKGSPMFTRPGATRERDNFIEVRGLYSKELKRMRLIGVIDLAQNDCVAEKGACTNNTADALRIHNPFARKVRRVIEFIGPFDEQSRTFRGVYRDKISGLSPSEDGGTITLQGDFNLGQMNDEGSFDRTAWQRPMLSATTSGTTVPFPSRTTALAAVQQDINTNCDSATKAWFADASSYEALLADIHLGSPQDDGVLPTPVTFLPTPVTFGGEVSKALAALKNAQGGSNAALSFYDLLRDQLRFCDGGPSVLGSPSCIDRKALRCGLALFRKATLSLPSWVESWNTKPDPLGDSPTHALFCASGTAEPGSAGADCTLDGSAGNATLVTLLEHNRFYKELTQTLGFSAGAAASEAAILLYKKAANMPLASTPGVVLDSAFAVKKYQLRQAFNDYEDARKQLLPPAPAYILYEWPMRSFVGNGQSWMAQMRGLVNSRLEALEDYLDLARRQQRVETEQLSLFMHHVGQQEFLTQVYLMNLQAQWEGSQYQHSPAIQDSLDRVTALLAKSDITRNPFGLEANRVYFENTDPNLANWEYYRNAAQQKLNAATSAIKGPGGALEALRANLANKNALESALRDSRLTYDAILDNLCGPQVESDASLPAACASDAPERLEEAACFGPDCKAAWNCEDEACKRVIQTFEAGLRSLQAGNQACVISNPSISVPYEGGRRPCVRGQVGELLQEKVLLELQRKQAGAELATLLNDIRAGSVYLERVQTINTMAGLTELVATAATSALAVGASAATIEIAKAKAEATYCIAGVATDCATKLPAYTNLILELSAVAHEAGAAQMALEGARAGIQALLLKLQNDKEVARELYALETRIGQAELTVHKVAILTQQTFNLDMRIDDLIQQANVASYRRNEAVNDVIAAVSGQNLGEAVTLNAQVAQSNRLMREALVDAYKMTVAYLHRSNSKTKWEPLVDGIYTAVTLGDLQNRIDQISLAASTCTESDCDGPRNSELRWFSLRDNLFPTLTDIIAADTGATLTKGQQFHNILTSSAYRRRRMVGGNMLDVIEIPFATRALAETGQAGFTVNSCNDVIVPFKLGQADAGTLVVNFSLSRRPPNREAPEYVLVRGSTDQMLGCTKTSPPSGGPAYFPISSFLVGPPGGYAERMAGSDGSGEAFFTQSGSWKGCINAGRDEQELFNKGCFKTFARERSYGSLEWTLILPIVPATSTSPGKNSWLNGGDIVVHDIELGLRVSAATRSN